MPNLKQSKLFRDAYVGTTPQWLTLLSEENFQKTLFSKRPKNSLLTENLLSGIARNFNPNASLQPKDIETMMVLETQREVESVLLFIDITSFSTKISGWSTEKLSKYLDEYYAKVIPIIYQNKGEVEKIVGDGIICIFAEPFCEKEDILLNANQTAMEIINTLKGTDKEVKIALHNGNIMYYKNKTDYFEYTNIGKPLTELWRLESIAENNAINFYSTTPYDDALKQVYNTNWPWILSYDKAITPALKGVSFAKYKTLTKK